MHDALWLCAGLLILLVVTNLWLVSRVLRPLRRLAQQANRLTEGDFAALELPCGGIKEVEALRRSLFAMVGHVRRVQEQQRQYADALLGGQEAERSRIARELHDDTVQSLIGIAQGIDLATTWITERPTEAVQRLKEVRGQAVEAATNLRNLIGALRPPALEELGLVSALKMLATQSKTMDVQVHVEGDERRLSENHELTLFRTAQETLKNSERHSGASNVTITAHYNPKHIRLQMHDNGKGFALPTSLDQFASTGHYGLVGMQERVQRLKGSFAINATPGKGTKITIELPINEEAQPTDVVRDPVCSALIKPHRAYANLLYKGQTYYFCCPVCQGAFQKNPPLYLEQLPHTTLIAEPKG